MTETEKNLFDGDDTQTGRYLTFLLGKDTYGIGIEYVIEIIGIQPITKIPETPDFVKGVINLRGQIIPVMDMRMKFHKEPLDYNDRTCVIITRIQDTSIGLIVDRVAEVLAIPETNIVPPPEFCTGDQNPYIEAIGNVDGAVKLLLDSNKLLIEEELLLLENIKGEV
jgi:purine-binding chemotaxis protein CheW